MSDVQQEWFIEPRNIQTNEQIANELASIGQVFESEMHSLEAVTEQGKHVSIKAWRVLHTLVDRFHRARKVDSSYVFRIFTRSGSRGIVREWVFEGKKKPSKKVDAVIKKIDEFRSKKKQ